MKNSASLAALLSALLLGSAGCPPGAVPSTSCDPPCTGNSVCDEASGTCRPVTTPDLGGGGPPDLVTASCTPPCAAPTPYCNAQKQCVACLKDGDCPNGTVCRTGVLGASCVTGCTDDSRCPMGLRCCGNACVDTNKDVMHCGGCAMACSANHAVATCTAGVCKASSCQPNWGDCNMDPKDGCETNLRAESEHCGGCGMKCNIPNALTGCSGACYVKACKFGFDDCNRDEKDGCETSVASDIKNCGACGKLCNALPNARAACVNSVCGVAGCNQGFGDCDGNAANGCEMNIFTNAANCGGCGMACPQGLVCANGGCTCPNCNRPNATTRCVNNVCVLDACVQGYANCDNNDANGCEINLTNDSKNCSSCGMTCVNPNPTCSGGMCVPTIEYGPNHTFEGQTSNHYITQGGCSAANGNVDQDAAYFCTRFYGQRLGLNCTPKPGYVAHRTPNCADSKMHKRNGCTGQGTSIPNTMCDGGTCMIGNWNECTSGVGSLICVCR